MVKKNIFKKKKRNDNYLTVLFWRTNESIRMPGM